MNRIAEPLTFDFMQRGLLAATLVGIVCSVAGTYVVLRGMAFFGDALAHAILPGIAVGYLAGRGSQRGLFWWAMGAAILSALGIGWITQKTKIKQDTAIGIVFSGMFALGIALISTVHNYAADLTHLLFGNILGVSSADLWLIFIFGGMVLLLNMLFYKEFRIIAFDPVLAKTLRLPDRFLNFLQLLMIAVVIVVSLQTVGIGLMVAMLITPPATAFLLTRRLWKMMVIAAILAALSGLSGLYISYFWGVSSGASIVLVATLMFIAAWGLQFVFKRN